MAPVSREVILVILLMCESHVKFLSISKPSKSNVSTDVFVPHIMLVQVYFHEDIFLSEHCKSTWTFSPLNLL